MPTLFLMDICNGIQLGVICKLLRRHVTRTQTINLHKHIQRAGIIVSSEFRYLVYQQEYHKHRALPAIIQLTKHTNNLFSPYVSYFNNYFISYYICVWVQLSKRIQRAGFIVSSEFSFLVYQRPYH